MSSEGEWKVEVWVYDLSQGMAAKLSGPFLGKQIDGIWHTGIVCYGKEFYYGGGIQRAKPPGTTVAGRPVRVHELGTTSIPEELFEEFLREIGHKYTPETYSLLRNNCNNFSNEAAIFLTGNPIPEYITGLPEEALSTPMGMMLKGMIEEFEGNMKRQFVPWTEPGAPGSAPVASGGAAPAPFPSIPFVSPTPAAAASMASAAKKVSASSTPKIVALSDASVVDDEKNKLERIGRLESHAHFKLTLKRTGVSTKPFLSLDPEGKDPEQYVELIRGKQARQKSPPVFSVDLFKDAAKFLRKEVDSISRNVLDYVFAALGSWSAADLFPVIAVLRLLCTRPSVADFMVKEGKAEVRKVLELCKASTPLATRLMSLCTVANLFSHLLAADFAQELSETISEIVVECLEDKQKAVRLLAATISLNLALVLPKTENELGIALLSGLAHVSSIETDDETLSRVLSAISHFLFCSEWAPTLLPALEYSVSAAAKEKSKEFEEDISQLLASE